MTVHRSVMVRAAGRVGQMLRDKYTLDRLIGIGGSAAVYAGRHRNGMRVAVKVLHPEIAAIAEAKRRFLREGYIANRVEHPGVVRVLDDDEDSDGTAFLTMELLDGVVLEEEWQRAPDKRLSLKRVVALADDLLAILDAAHRATVVHRDLKPDNIVVLVDGTLKVLDFGIARLLDDPRTTPTGDAMGSAEFVAPEQARGHARDADARADVYAVGAIMFSLLSGTYVHDASNPLERLILAATKPAPAVRRLVPELSDDVAHVIDLALSFDREHRWPNAGKMREALSSSSPKQAAG